jgi:hypothetical protein
MDQVQWPAMALTVVAAWFVTAQSKRRRRAGFWFFLGSNVLWTIWGIHASAYALVVLQIALGAINIWGAHKTSSETEKNLPSISQP